MEVQKDLFDSNQPSTSGQVRAMPERFEQLNRNPPTKKVSKLKDVFKICLALIHDKYAIAKLTTLIEDNTVDMRHEKRVNHVGIKWKTF